MKRGDIIYVTESEKSTGSEWMKDRPAIIVSNDFCNEHSPVIEVVYLTTSHRKRFLPTYVVIHSSPQTSVALCEAVYSVDISRVIKTGLKCKPFEMVKVNNALAISLGLI